MNYSVINKSQLEGALRLDAEYYQPEYLGLIKNLNNLGAVPIRNVAINPQRKFKPQKGKTFQYIEISEVDLSTGEYNKAEILGENTPDRAQWIVKKDDVIVSTVRPIRNAVSLIGEDVQNLVCSSGFAVLKSEKIEPEYLFIYLKTKPIVALLDRLTTATMYPAITVDDILNTKIYLGSEDFRQKIKNKIIESQKELENSKFFYSKAENLLLEELGLKNFKNEEYLFSIVNLSDVKFSHRIDAEYFQPKYEKIFAQLSKQKTEALADHFQVIRSKNFDYKEEGEIGVIKTKQLGRQAINYEVEDKTTRETLEKEKLPLLHSGDVVFASMGVGSLGKINIHYDTLAPFTIDSTLRIFRSKTSGKILPEFLVVFLSSWVGQEIVYKYIVGSSGIISIYEDDIKNLKIPILSKPIQQKIADLVKKSHEARKKAKELLEQAKQKVEKLIEK